MPSTDALDLSGLPPTLRAAFEAQAAALAAERAARLHLEAEMAGLSGIPCAGGHSGMEGDPACPDANRL